MISILFKKNLNQEIKKLKKNNYHNLFEIIILEFEFFGIFFMKKMTIFLMSDYYNFSTKS